MDKFEEYKLFVEDTARFSERRQTVTNTYVTVNSIVLTAVAFMVKDAGVAISLQKVAVTLLLIAGIATCVQWHRLIAGYKRLVDFRIGQLRIIESHPQMADSHRMYHAEDALYPRDAEGKSRFGLNLSNIERWLPILFIVVYASMTLAVVIGASVGW